MAKKEYFRIILTVLLIASLSLTVISGSIAVPILFRPFYYMQINSLELPETTGYTYSQIKEAFDEMMDFCVLGKEFGTGVLKWSEEGRSHFADCSVLFMLDLTVLACSVLVSVLIIVYIRVIRKKNLYSFGGFHPVFYAGIVPLALFTVLGLLVSINFDRAFVVFHQIFFSGKENWIFDPSKDEIIKILPETFFMNCAILIFAVLVVTCIVLIVIGIILKKTNKKQKLSTFKV